MTANTGLVLFLAVFWGLFVAAVKASNWRAGKRWSDGPSLFPMIPVAALVAGAAGWLVNLAVSPWGSWGWGWGSGEPGGEAVAEGVPDLVEPRDPAVVFETGGCDPLGKRTIFEMVAAHLEQCAGIYLSSPFTQNGECGRDATTCQARRVSN